MPRNSSRKIQDVFGGIYMNDFQILDCDAIASHAAGHAHSLRHFVAQAATYRTRLAFAVFLAVTTRSAVETVTLDHALESLAL